MIPFFMEWGHISFTRIMILQSWFMLWIFLLEVPTGAVADYLGRKWSLVFAAIANTIAAIIYGSFPNFYVFLVGEFVWAMSAALMSGADEAFIYDTLKKVGKTDQSKKIFARLESTDLLAIGIASPVGGLIAAHFGLQYPMLFAAIPMVLGAIIGLTFKEPETNQKIESKRYLKILKEGFTFFFKHKVLRILTLDTVVIGAVAYFMIWFFQPMLKNAGIGVAYYGFVHASFVVSQVLIMNNYQRLERLFGSKKRVIFFSALITGLMFIIGGLTTFVPAVIAVIIIGGGFGLSRKPLFSAYMNKYIPSDKRATVLSTVSMMRRFVLVILNPIVGYAVDWSLSYTMIILGAIAVIFAFVSQVEERHLKD